MNDEGQNLRSTLSELHRQLEAARTVDPQAREMLRQVLADIDRVLAEMGEEPPAGERAQQTSESLIGRLADAARHFEESHPTLFGSIGSVIDALSRMGI